ncbi:MAG: hypothetical protein WBE38_02385, partial [Terracidiphilus sp.]
ALEVGGARLLVLPVANEAGCGFPVPLLPRVARLQESFFVLRALRAMLTRADSLKSRTVSVTAVTHVGVA